jgi:hypothetical protein
MRPIRRNAPVEKIFLPRGEGICPHEWISAYLVMALRNCVRSHRLWRDHGKPVVTLKGEVIMPGIMIGGRNGAQASLLSRNGDGRA